MCHMADSGQFGHTAPEAGLVKLPIVNTMNLMYSDPLFFCLDTLPRTIVGIIVGVIIIAAAVVMVIIIVAVAMWIYYSRHHHRQCEFEFPHGGNGEEELQVGLHITSSHNITIIIIIMTR